MPEDLPLLGETGGDAKDAADAKDKEPKKRKGGKGKKPSRKRLKLTDSNWEQAFLISYLEQFVEARETYFPTENGAVERIGEFVGMHGNQIDMLGLLVDAAQVDAFANLNAAQASALMPLISLQKVATPQVLSIYPDTPKVKPIAFADHLDLRAILEKKFHMVNGAGIKDITIIRKFGKTGPLTRARAEVDLTFEFDSMETFVRNQRDGLSFLDLIPTGTANMKTAGRKDVLWNLRLKFGYRTPKDSTAKVFSGVKGRRALAAVGNMNRSWQLMYGGKHDIAILDNGGVELKIKFLTTSEAVEGDEAQLRSNILGKALGLPADDQQDERQKLQDKLEKLQTEAIALAKSIDKIEADYQKQIQGKMEEFQRNQKSLSQMAAAGDEEAHAAVTRAERGATRGGRNFSNRYIADKDLLEARVKHVASADAEDIPTFSEYEEAKEAFQNELKSAASSRDEAMKKKRGELVDKQILVGEVHQQLANLGSVDVDPEYVELKYASLIARLHQEEKLFCLDLSPKEISDYSSRSRSKQYKKFKDFKGKLMERLEGKPPSDWLRPTEGTKQEEIMKFIHDMNNKYIKAEAENPVSAKAKPPLKGGELRNKRVYYFYLGDLLDICMKNFYGNAETVVGGGDRTVKNDRTNTVQLMLGDFYYNRLSGERKPRKKKKPENESIAFNMMDFPISLTAFSRFFVDRFVRLGVEQIPLETFLSEMANFFFGQPVFQAAEKYSYGPLLNPQLQHQQWNFVFGEFVTAVKLERGWSQKQSVGNMYDMNGDEMKKLFINHAPKDSVDKVLYSYLTIGPGHAANLPTQPVFTLHLGTENSIIKTVKYNAAGGSKRSRTTRIMKAKAAKKGMPKLPPAAAYSVDLDLMGTPFWAPGMCFELNNNVFGTMDYSTAGGTTALTDEGDDLMEILPRLLRVSEVTHKISSGDFTTSIKCRAVGTTYRKYMDSRGDEIYNLTSIAKNLKAAAKEENKAKKKARKKK